MTGTLRKKARRQLTVSTRTPPTRGPRIDVAAVAAAQIPNARPRAGPSNVAVMIDSEHGTSSAPAAPWKTRKRARSSRLGARPHRAEVMPNAIRPMVKTRRRP